ncbi:MAG: ATP-binding protein, partial [Alphaproteobacteria bacterium]|nr:ATP-binding protein [Alphaproteobacteria bacterium]
LQTSARTLGQGGIVTPSTSLIREANNVVTVMSDVSLLLIERSKAVIDLNNSLETQVDERTATLVNEIARREESEKQLRQLYKLEAVGSLTGGIAHDFNNMLAVVMSGLNLARRRLARGETDIAQFLDGATRGAESAAKLTKQLLAFSRQQALSPEAVDCNRLITSMADMLRRTIPANIEIETALAGGLWRTCADVPALENAILNLSINARDAMAGVGKLTIETSNMHLDDTYAASHAEVTAGQYVMVAVTDTGTGIPAEIINEVFEPFFSTKELGQGTGLGLSQVYGFIKQSGGHINIYSEKNQGTTVKLYLPRLVNDAQLRDLAPLKPEKMPMSQNNELLLVVEDDAGVRAGTVAMLKELGYAVLEAEDGVNALHILETNPDIQLLMSEV